MFHKNKTASKVFFHKLLKRRQKIANSLSAAMDCGILTVKLLINEQKKSGQLKTQPHNRHFFRK